MVGAAGQGNEIVNTPEEDSGAWTSRGASGGEANAQLTPPGSGGTAKPRTDSEWEDWEAQVLAQLAGNAGAAEEPLSDGVDARHASALQRAWLNYGAGQPESALRAMAGVPDALWVESRLFVGPVALLRAWMYRETGDDAAMRSAARVAVEIIALRAAAHPGDPAPEIAAAQAHALLGETGAAFGAMGRYDDATEGDSHAWDGQKAIVWAELQFNPDLIDRLIARFRGTMAEWNGLDSWLRWDPRLAAWRQRQP
jgi:hypothetical protein